MDLHAALLLAGAICLLTDGFRGGLPLFGMRFAPIGLGLVVLAFVV